MILVKLTLAPKSSFMTLLKGDTLFGHLCWQIRDSLGNETLLSLLDGYCDNSPFVVVSDAFPKDCLPMPTMPLHLRTQQDAGEQVKKLKKRQWVSVCTTEGPVNQWLDQPEPKYTTAEPTSFRVMHNSLNRLTHSTGDGFDPFTLHKYLYPKGAELDVYCVVDDELLPVETLVELVKRIGLIGYGKKANTGHGKFDVNEVQVLESFGAQNANAYLTLAKARVPSEGWHSDRSFYSITTQFGRHGAALVHQQPFKNPVLMMETGALLVPKDEPSGLWVGQGVTGVSEVMPETVQPAYAPVVPVYFDATLGDI